MQAYVRAMDAHDLRGGAEAAWELVSTANLYIQQVAPWKLAKEGRDAELDVALAALARALYRLTVVSLPFIPGKAAGIWESLGASGKPADAAWETLAAPPVGGLTTHRPETLFPKLAGV
jgi:methionyl-tRNA synthetase